MSDIVASYVPSKTAHLTPLIDADSLVYRAGFSGVEKDEKGNPFPTPLSHSLSNLRTIMDNILDKFPRREGEHVFLTPSGGFRYKVATIREYKGNRKSPKPQHFQAMREYLQKKYGAVVVDEDLPEDQRREADDFCGMYQWAKPDKSTCVVSGDKDLKQIPGWLYSPARDEFQMRTLNDADMFFWFQVMAGDCVDNVKGLSGIGEKKALKILEACCRKRSRVRRAVCDLYRKEYSDKWESALDENATLVFIHREEGKNWRDYHWH